MQLLWSYVTEMVGFSDHCIDVHRVLVVEEVLEGMGRREKGMGGGRRDGRREKGMGGRRGWEGERRQGGEEGWHNTKEGEEVGEVKDSVHTHLTAPASKSSGVVHCSSVCLAATR